MLFDWYTPHVVPATFASGIWYSLRLLTERTFPRDNCTLDLSLFIRSLATLAFNVNESWGSFILLTFRIHKPRSYIGLWTRGDRINNCLFTFWCSVKRFLIGKGIVRGGTWTFGSTNQIRQTSLREEFPKILWLFEGNVEV